MSEGPDHMEFERARCQFFLQSLSATEGGREKGENQKPAGINAGGGRLLFGNHRAPSCHYRGGRRETIGRREVFRGKRAGVVSEASRDGGKAGPGKRTDPSFRSRLFWGLCAKRVLFAFRGRSGVSGTTLPPPSSCRRSQIGLWSSSYLPWF